MNERLMRLAHAVTALVLAGTFSHAAAAADTAATEAPGELQEVVVTAEKRSENLEKAPTTVSVVTGEDLATRGVEDISQATAVFPSVKFGQISGTVHLYIRGIGAEQDRASIDPLSAMTENGVVLPREVTGNNLYDLAAIEVLPGPQSTLYSTSAAGGIVNVVDQRPTKNQEGYAALEIGNYDLKHVTAVENVPLTDTLFARVAFNSVNHDGYETSGADSADQVSARVSLLYTPSDEFTGYT
ncbi:MAG TPA: TonB-dependent receptor plug domain-containing protein, partial [Steroidobacteraceae bacterium]|nr:TonB-dependent receptor plug domain-containing protein [Steroidobacteraceae bacterium]